MADAQRKSARSVRAAQHDAIDVACVLDFQMF
jgi:hypothetical protein